MTVQPPPSPRNPNYSVLVITLCVVSLVVILGAAVLLVTMAPPHGPAAFAADEPRVEWIIAVGSADVQRTARGVDGGREDVVAGVQRTIARRLRGIDVAKWNLTRRPAAGGGDLLVQVTARPVDIGRIRTLVASRGFELRLVETGPVAPIGTPRLQSGETSPLSTRVFPGVGAGGTPVFYLLAASVIVSGADVATARVTRDELGKPAIGFTLTKDGAARMYRATEENVGRHLAIVISGRVESAPVIDGPIGQEGRITGTFTDAEANDLALILRSGDLPAAVSIVSERQVNPRPPR